MTTSMPHLTQARRPPHRARTRTDAATHADGRRYAILCGHRPPGVDLRQRSGRYPAGEDKARLVQTAVKGLAPRGEAVSASLPG